jgi:hypothetical protein
MAGALCIAQAPILHPEDTPEGLQSLLWVPNHVGLYLGYILLQFGILGIVLRQLQPAGKLGTAGAMLAFVGTSLMLMEGRDHIFSLPILRLAGLQTADPEQLPGLWQLIMNAAVFGVGHIVLGIATVRARVLPTVPAIAMGLGALIFGFSPPLGGQAALVGAALYAGAMFWLGYSLVVRPSAARMSAPRPAMELARS